MLHAFNKSTVRTYDQISITLDSGLRRQLSWIFIIVDVAIPILGIDILSHFNLLDDVRSVEMYFFSHFNLLVDVRFVDSATALSVPARISSGELLSPISFEATARNKYCSLLKLFPELTDPISKTTGVVHSPTHHISTTGPPVYYHPSRLAPDH